MRNEELSFDLVTEGWEELARWLSSETWPYHGRARVPFEEILAKAEQGAFAGDDVRCFWVHGGDGPPLALVRLFDLADLTPLFDLRVRSVERGRGVGTACLRWASDHVFTTRENANRFGGYTRHDNLPMRRVFEKAGFTLEAVHREGWEVEGGTPVDCVGYFLLRREWSTARVHAGDESTRRDASG